MRPRRGNDRGLAEIVGTLMLVLIVVAAAVAFSFFVASYQAQLQAEETLQHDQALESLHVLSVAPGKINVNGTYIWLNFTLVSDYINPSTVTQLTINNNPLRMYEVTVLNFTTGLIQHTVVPGGVNLVLSPQQEVTVTANFTNGPSSFYVPYVLTTSQYVKISAFTSLTNDFSRVFIPPTAVAVVSNTTSSGGTQTTLLDGSMSFQPEGNATVVAWAWTVTNATLSYSKSFVGEEAQTPLPLYPPGPYTVTLLVTNSDGLTGMTVVDYNP